MGSITAVELGADICAFARTSVRRGEIRLTAAELLDPAAFPGMDAFTLAVRQTRRSLRLPRRCRAVVWGLPDGASRTDAVVKPLIEPLTAAGFSVQRVVSPCNALAALARRMKTSRGEGSTCWIAINRGGVAIVVVRPGKLLYAHSFAWDSSVGSSGSQARLLQRYSLVSFLSPEIKRAMAESRKFGMPVDAVVTCGNLPDLRSLTMPLIEELDVEVETLDSLEGLVVTPQVAEKLAEWAPAIRIACAAAIARGTRPWDPSKKTSPWHTAGTYARAAALAVAVAGIGYLWYMRFAPDKRVPAPPAVSVQSTILPPDPASAKAAAGRPTPSAKAQGGNYPLGTDAPPPALSESAKQPESKGALSESAKQPEPKGAVSESAKQPESKGAPSVAAPAVSVPAKAPESKPKSPEPKSAVSAPATPPKSNPPAVSALATSAKSNSPAPIPWKPAVVPRPALSESAPAVSVPAKSPASNPKQAESKGAASVPKKPESNTAAKTPAPSRPAPGVNGPATRNLAAGNVAAKRPAFNPTMPAPVTASTTVPRARVQPLVTLPLPNTSAPKAPAPPSTLAGVPASGVTARPPAPAPARPAVTPASPPRPSPSAASVPANRPPEGGSYRAGTGATAPPALSESAKKPESKGGLSEPAKKPESNGALNPPASAADKPEAGRVVRSLSQAPAAETAPAALRPMAALIKDAVPRVTAILVARDRRFATIDGGQIIGIGDVLGRRTVVGMDERGVVFQEPSGVQIRIGLGGRLLGIERAARQD